MEARVKMKTNTDNQMTVVMTMTVLNLETLAALVS
jgi:hypothetical protein